MMFKQNYLSYRLNHNTIPGQSRPWSDSNEAVASFLQEFLIGRLIPRRSLVPYDEKNRVNVC